MEKSIFQEGVVNTFFFFSSGSFCKNTSLHKNKNWVIFKVPFNTNHSMILNLRGKFFSFFLFIKPVLEY